MCGIVGLLRHQPVGADIVESLKRLEYRGYDSAGIATLEADGKIHRRRAEGKLRNLDALLMREPLDGTIGIGHTRWATHGAPTEANAHPHATARVAVVHNGIIENYREIRDELTARGHVFASQTDTEAVAQLVDHFLGEGLSPADAVARALKRITGAFALGFIFAGHPDLIIGARRGSPLAVGYGEGEMFLGSDAIALGPFTNRIAYLDEGDWVILTRAGATIHDEADRRVDRPIQIATAATFAIDRGNFRHFMAKEIHEQPEVVSHTVARYIDFVSGGVRPQTLPFDWTDLDRVTISACGTAYLAGLVGKYWFERLARLPVDIDVASEFRYREQPMPRGGLSLFVSQSGETADTLASLRYCKAEGQHIGAIVNVPTSTIAREADVVFPTLAGIEVGVASTKAFTCQLAVLLSLAIAAGRARGVLSIQDEARLAHGLVETPRHIAEILRLEPQIEQLAKRLSKARDVLYLGRGTSYPIALEGALKLKEISYIHAEGYAAGELKHGPIALIDETMPVIVIAPFDRIFEKTVSNMQEVAARGGRIILITDAKGAAAAPVEAVETIVLPDMPATVTPIAYAIPIQLLAYHTAVIMGTDVDQPRNLAKSVTVE